MSEERKKSSLNASRPDGWVWMRSPGTESKAVRREGSLEVQPTDPSRSPQIPPGQGSKEGRVPFILTKPEEGRGAEGAGCGLPG